MTTRYYIWIDRSMMTNSRKGWATIAEAKAWVRAVIAQQPTWRVGTRFVIADPATGKPAWEMVV